MSAAIEATADVLILGAGPAGLACAGGLARQLHSALVFGHGAHRNARAARMHNVVGWEHADPAAFRAKALADLAARYAGFVRFRDVEVRAVRRLDAAAAQAPRFQVEDVDGCRYEGRRLVLAMGVADAMPETPRGYADLWGYAIFHCLFCHGFEERGAVSAGVLATGLLGSLRTNHAAEKDAALAPIMARMAARLAGTVTVYTDGDEDLARRVRAELRSARRFRVESRRVAKLEKDPGVAGVAGLLAHVPATAVNLPDVVSALGIRLAPQGHIETTAPFYAAAGAPGVFAAGDCAAPLKSVPVATMMGSCVAAGLAHELQAEDNVED
ncbi:FAD/NAD(P)-binding domain-containing protein [Durotheca rogersii]|uniref:FAD/NAD(P)-binding domain-containing protein n=1 Tax=Durotheca rogersii TaxID=419775 RepID=UPI00221EABDD|nr:FAD/NAD(P)-binding domain-containing protein [Durotheca rogersii]KAI5862007.1 FAD/NAD(P)-binding domain-containing protein [Durotheca rogersii]